MKTLSLPIFAMALCWSGIAFAFTQTEITGPAGSDEFGTAVYVLPNGNFVVTDPAYDQPSPAVANCGAVYLYSSSGTLISKLTGGTANNQVGSGGIRVLKNGNFVVVSPGWDSAAPPATNAGAVTWGSATTGFGAPAVVVSSANSLVGSTSNDAVGSVAMMPNGNYVVSAPSWNIPAGTADVGAVTYCNGTTGTSGAVSTSNSLTGTTAADNIGSNGVRLLDNGHYIVASPLWNIPAGAADVGALTWVNGNTGIPYNSGSPGVTVSTSNSLVGSTAGDQVASFTIDSLPNGGYVVVSNNWDSPTYGANVGAVTFSTGTGIAGAVSSANSLIGSSPNDQLGNLGITVLTNGNYVVGSPQWSVPSGAANVGAVTWCSGTTGRTGLVLSTNSLVGVTINDSVSSYGITALSNGNYVVISSDWSTPTGTASVGAITWCNGTTGTTGTVTDANSLIGTSASDRIGSGNVIKLTNGNYVVSSPSWSIPSGAFAVGAATWGNGTTGTKGVVSAANSLIGSTANDLISLGGVVPLTNGNYVVVSNTWNAPGGISEAGAVTWGNGTTGVKGPVSAANSLVGKTAFDDVGISGVIALTNGNYVVGSEKWNLPGPPAIATAGAATWCNGTTGAKGPVTTANSLVGSTANDLVGSTLQALPNGNYLIRTTSWDNGAVADVGAFTWANGTTGIKGVVSTLNSLVGTTAVDKVGQSAHVLSDNFYLARSASWDQTNPATTDSGAFTLCNAATGTTGIISTANSVLGTTANGGSLMNYDFDTVREQFIVGRPSDNKVTILGNQFHTLAKTGLASPGAIDIAFSTPGTAAVSNAGTVIDDFTLTGAGASGKNHAIYSTSSAANPLDLILQTGTNIAALGNGLPTNAKLLTVLSPQNQQNQRALFQATFSGTGITSSNNRLLLKDDGFTVSILRRTGQTIGVGALANATPKTFNEVLQSNDIDLITLSYTLATSSSIPINSGNDSGILFLDHSGSPLSNIAAQEGKPAFGGSGTFGQFTGRAAAGLGLNIHFVAPLKPTSGSTVNAVFTTSSDGVITLLDTKAGDAAPPPVLPGDTSLKFGSFPALAQQGPAPLFKATLTGCPSSTNEAIYLGTTPPLVRKGTDVNATALPGVKFGSVSRFWPAGASQVIVQCSLSGTGVTSSNNQALVLHQADGTNYVLFRTGSTPPGIDAARVLAISAVEVNPVNGRYAVLATLTNSTSSRNQALWTGNTSLGADTPANSQAQRLPVVRLRKGDRYSSDATPLGVIKSLTLKPAIDSTGAGGRGLAQSLGSNGDLAIYILGDRNLTELVLLPPGA